MLEFHKVTRGRKPEHLLFFRDGVSEGQFKEVYYVSRAAVPGHCLKWWCQWCVCGARDSLLLWKVCCR